MSLGIVMDFSHPYSHSMDLKKGKLLLPIAVARVLGIATNRYKPNPLVEVLNPSFSLAEEKNSQRRIYWYNRFYVCKVSFSDHLLKEYLELRFY